MEIYRNKFVKPLVSAAIGAGLTLGLATTALASKCGPDGNCMDALSGTNRAVQAETKAPVAVVEKKVVKKATTCGDGTEDKYNLIQVNEDGSYNPIFNWNNPDCVIGTPKTDTYATRNFVGLSVKDNIISPNAKFRFNGESNLTRSQLENSLLRHYDNNGKSDSIDIYFTNPKATSKEAVVETQVLKPETVKAAPVSVETAKAVKSEEVIPGIAKTVGINDNYANINGVSYALVLPAVEGANWPTLITTDFKTTSILGYDEDGKLRTSKYSYDSDESSLALGVLHAALNGSVEDHTLSNNALAYAIQLNKGESVENGSDFVRKANLETVLAKDSCMGEEVCATLTPQELADASGNLAAYEQTAKDLVQQAVKEGIIDPQGLNMFVSNNPLTKYSKSIAGVITPTNTIIRLATGSTGLNRNGDFKSDYNTLEKTCLAANTVKSDASVLFSCVYDGVSNLFSKYKNGGKDNE